MSLYKPLCSADRLRTQGLYILSIPGNYWKVGIAVDVYDRVRQLQCGCPEKIEVECFVDPEIDGVPAYRMEREMHLKLQPYRTYGEWFHAPFQAIRLALKETWMQLHHPNLYDRLERMRAHRRASYYRRQAKASKGEME